MKSPDIITPPIILTSMTAAAEEHELDVNWLQTTGYLESRFNPSSQNPNSSAGGLFQFIDSTAEEYKLKDRFDPAESSMAAGLLMKRNKEYLEKKLGREITVGEAYLAHQQGAAGARVLLENPDITAWEAIMKLGFSEEDAKKRVSLNGGTEKTLAKDFANKWIKKAEKISKKF